MKKIHETKHTKKYNCIHCVVILGETTVRQNELHFESSSSTAATIVKVYEEKSQYCDSCSKTLSKQSQLTTQIRSTHEKEKLPCDSSGKVFSKRRHLKLHRTPLCQACDYKFSQWSDLAKHSDQHSEVQQCQDIECFKPCIQVTILGTMSIQTTADSQHFSAAVVGNDSSRRMLSKNMRKIMSG